MYGSRVAGGAATAFLLRLFEGLFFGAAYEAFYKDHNGAARKSGPAVGRAPAALYRYTLPFIALLLVLLLPLPLLETGGAAFTNTASAYATAASAPAPAAAAVNSHGQVQRQVVLVCLDKVTLEDLLAYGGPVLTSVLEKSGAALMNVNTAGLPGTEGGYLTIGSGARVQGNWTARVAYNREERKQGFTGEVLYGRYTGKEEVPPGEVLHVYAANLQELNEGRRYPLSIGALGEALQLSGRAAAVIGNADTDSEGRQAVTIAMDRDGIVLYGNVTSSLLRENGRFPFGRSCDAGAYVRAFEDYSSRASFIVVDWGDTARINAYLPQLPAGRRGELLRETLQELDRFLEEIIPRLAEQSKLFLLAPSPPPEPYAGGQRLAPLVIYDPASPLGGKLVSSTTRRQGIVANIDIAPTVIDYLDLAPPVFLWGASLENIPSGNHLEELAALSESTARIYTQRPSIVRGYILAQIILIATAMAGLLFRFKPARRLFPYLYGLLFLPLAALVAPAFFFFPFQSLHANALLILFLTVLLTFFGVSLFKRPVALLAFGALLIFGLTVFDLWKGAPLGSSSFLGYDPIGGARYYGIGNEYMGVAVGTFLLAAGTFYSLLEGQKNPRLLVLYGPLFIFLAIFLIYTMASPAVGANFGGAVTAGVALAVMLAAVPAQLRKKGIALLPFLQRPALPGGLLLPAVFLLAAFFLLFYLNVPRSGETISHLGRTWELVRAGGIGELGDVFIRKAEMNLKLVRFSLWSRSLLLFIAVMTVLYYYPVGLMHEVLRKNSGFKMAMGGIVAASITSFLVNDSGVVSASIIMLYGALPLLLLCLEEAFGDDKSFNKARRG